MSTEPPESGASASPSAGDLRVLSARLERQEEMSRGFAEVLALFARLLIEHAGVPAPTIEAELDRIGEQWQRLKITPEAPGMVKVRLRDWLAAEDRKARLIVPNESGRPN